MIGWTNREGYQNLTEVRDMKAILEFNLPEEREDFVMATDGIKYYSAILELYNDLRSKVKYGNMSGDAMTAYEDIYRKVNNIMVELNLFEID